MTLPRPRALFAAALIALALLFVPRASPAQGCTQCQDSTASTPPRTQAAYRRAIILMTVTASGLFFGGVFLLRRHR